MYLFIEFDAYSYEFIYNENKMNDVLNGMHLLRDMRSIRLILS